MSEQSLTLDELRELVTLLNESYPWPSTVNQIVLLSAADRLAKRRGFENWIHAYHCLVEVPKNDEQKTGGEK